ncbi:peptidoglycan-associated lipoprotein [Desulfobaculum xiamenense]|uniref:Peptidoglycan-associated lipoprotein n=1 Tax=Desulfobaculum xiamenense TaxID=995050 RepID=A0A846QQ72_9BACT|nr:peptidoglycan-associated lipoprotein Pal [Desulfobaculum xiamenense]NJB67364.1 peptidoglycan-associated lipoprotein [Desulfobaculum xiamenense]
MRMKLLVVMVMMALVLALGTGCAKKQMSAEPAPATDQSANAGSLDASEQALAEANQKAMVAAEKEITQNRIYFDFDKFDLRADSKEVLKAKAELLKKYPTWKLLVEGHCDERGTEEYNLALGERRARAAYEFLVVLGVPSSSLKVVSFGEERPADAGHNETAWSMNRRDEFKIFK